MDMDLRSELNLQMIAKGHDKKIQEHLLYTLNAQPNNWPTQVQNRALALLRSGDVKTFPQLLKQILEEVRRETGVLRPSPAGAATNGDHHQTNGGGSSNGNGNGNKKSANNNGASASSSLPGPGEASNLHAAASPSLALPQAAVDEALRMTKEVLSQVVEFEEEKGNGAS
ncbi:unnamed protein product [Discula destructiva]